MTAPERTLIVQLDVLGFNDLHPCEAARIVLGATGNRLIHAEWADNSFPDDGGVLKLSAYERAVVDTIDLAADRDDWKVGRLLEIIYRHLEPGDAS